jgi:hypothetical protein
MLEKKSIARGLYLTCPRARCGEEDPSAAESSGRSLGPSQQVAGQRPFVARVSMENRRWLTDGTGGIVQNEKNESRHCHISCPIEIS